MATKDYYKGVTIQYKGDDTQLSKVLANMNSEMRQSQGAARALQTALKMDPTSLNLIRDRSEVVAKQIKLTEDRVAALKEALGKAEDPEVITRLNQQVDIAEAKLKNLNEQMESLSKQEANASGLGKLATDAQSLGESLQGVGDKVSGVGDTMTKHLTAPIVGFTVATVGAATTIDSALTDVRKTVDGTEQEYQALKDAAIEYSKTNAVSADQVLQVQALGAQLGYAKEELEMIGRVGSGLDIATDMNAEQATTDMAQFANITKMAHDESENYASTIVALGNTTATTESKISSMAQRIAAAGSQVGMSNAEILGLAAGLSSVGMEAEAGGTAISTIISQIDKDVATGSENVATWAAAAGMSADEFAAAWREKPAEALQSVITSMGAAADAGGNMSVMLENLGINSIRQTDAMKRLAGNADVLATAVDTANRAWVENTALTEEVANRNDSLAARMEMVRNRVTAILEKIGKPIADALLAALDAAEPLFDAIESGAQAFADMDQSQQQAIVSAVGVVAAFGPLLSIVGRATGDVGSLISALGGGTEALAALGAAAPVAGAALFAAFAATDIIATLSGYVENLELVRDATDGVAEATELAGGVFDETTQSVSSLAEAEDGATESSATLSEVLKDATDGLRAASEYAKEAKDVLGGLGTDSSAVEEYASQMKELSSQSELTAAEQEKLKNAVEQYNEITGSAIEVTDATRGSLSLLPAQIDEVTEAYRRQAEQKAYVDLYNDAIKAQAENEMKLKQVTQEMGAALQDASSSVKLTLDPLTMLHNLHVETDVLKLSNSFNGLQQSSVELAGNVEYLEGKLNQLGDGSYHFSSIEAAMQAAGVTGQQYANLTQAQLDQIRAAFDGTIASISGILAKFGVAVGQTGAKTVSSISDTANDVVGAIGSGASKASDAQRKANDELYRQQQKANERALKEQQKANERANKELQKQLSAVYKLRSKELSAEEDQIRKANEQALSEQKKAFEEQEKALKSALDKRYSERSKELSAEVDAERKKNEKILKNLKASQSSEVKQYKAATDARIKEIDREYQAKLKLLEENSGAKQINERIKQLEAESEAEKRVNTENDRAEKIAELQREVDRANSRRKRAEAEKALADYLAEIAYEQREQERKDEIDRLDEQLSLIKEETSAKKDALKEQYDSQKEQYLQQREERLEQIQADNEAEYEKRKEALDLEIEQRREQNSQILDDLRARNDEQIQAMRDLHERQTSEYKEMLDNQLAVAREAHENELEQLKEHQSEIMDAQRESQQEQLDSMRDAQQEQLRNLKESLDSQLSEMSSAGGAAVATATDTGKKVTDSHAKVNQKLLNDEKQFNARYEREHSVAASTIVSKTTAAGKSMVTTVGNATSGMEGKFNSTRPKIVNTVGGMVSDSERKLMTFQAIAVNSGYNGGAGFATSISKGGSKAGEYSQNIANLARNPLVNVSDGMETSGWNLGINFANGIWKTISEVANAARSLASTVSSYLHHSVPEKGPLHEDNKWGADMVDNIISGMASKEALLADQSRRLAGIVSDEFNPELSARYDASLNLSMSQQRQPQWWQPSQFGGGSAINVEVHMEHMTIDNSMDIRQTARELAFETARELAASLG